ncbi:hypothetical protein [Terrimonas alba]|uniref:hypothetical protein n=1 Tax=Terrimonas alba TaxID=3349636 RepID=UPI0035F35374
MKFKDSKRNLALYLILRIDSSLHNERGFFMNAREYKDISIACHEITNSRRGYDDYNLILITKYPDEDSIYFNLRLKDFYGINPGEPFRHNKDTVIVNDFSFSNYYSFRPYNYAEQEDSNSIAKIFMTDDQGIVAYQYVNGEWWTKVK